MIHDTQICRNIIDNLYDAVYLLDTDRAIVYWNASAEKITGYKASEVVGKHCRDDVLIHVDAQGVGLCHTGLCPAVKVMNDQLACQEEIYLHHRDGHRVRVLARVIPLKGADGRIAGAAEIFTDNLSRAEFMQRIKELEEMALIDQLTKVPNRKYLEMNIGSRFAEMKRYGWPFGIIFMDIDNFKKVNDSYGHSIGDEILKIIAKTLLNSARPFDVIGRWGGEEFIAVITNIDKGRLFGISERFRLLVAQSGMHLNSESVKVTISIGAAIAQQDDTLEALIERADRLMYQSKKLGRNRVSMQGGL